MAPQGTAEAPKSGVEPPKGNQKRRRHRLRKIAGEIAGGRVAHCGRKMLGSAVTLHQRPGDDGHRFGGLETCGSVWTCPVCAVRITEARRLEIDAILKAHREAGGDAFMATLTIPHHSFQSCRELRKAVAAAWRKVKAGNPWVRARGLYSWLGDIRALEVTYGENGWHPHLHVLIFFRPGADKRDPYSLAGWLFERWAAVVRRLGYGRCSKAAFAYDRVSQDDGAADYVTKWGAALELTKAHVKRARSGRTPWQILEDAAQTRTDVTGLEKGNTGRRSDRSLFREYAEAFKGARQLTWSRDLRAIYLSEPEATDEDLASEPQAPEIHVASIDREVWRLLVGRGLTADVLLAADHGGVAGVTAVLAASGIPVAVTDRAGLEAGCYVPCVVLGHGPPGGSGS